MLSYPLVCHCAQENRLHKSQFETLGKLFPVREGNFPDPVILLARFGIFLTGFLGRSNPTDYGIVLTRSSGTGRREWRRFRVSEVSQFSNQHLTPPHEAPPTQFFLYMSSLVFLIIMVSPFSTLAFWCKNLLYICWWRFFLRR